MVYKIGILEYCDSFLPSFLSFFIRIYGQCEKRERVCCSRGANYKFPYKPRTTIQLFLELNVYCDCNMKLVCISFFFISILHFHTYYFHFTEKINHPVHLFPLYCSKINRVHFHNKNRKKKLDYPVHACDISLACNSRYRISLFLLPLRLSVCFK